MDGVKNIMKGVFISIIFTVIYEIIVYHTSVKKQKRVRE